MPISLAHSKLPYNVRVDLSEEMGGSLWMRWDSLPAVIDNKSHYWVFPKTEDAKSNLTDGTHNLEVKVYERPDALGAVLDSQSYLFLVRHAKDETPAPEPDPDPTPVPPPVEDCRGSYPFSAESLLSERVGFGAQTKGGDPNKIYRVKNLNDSGSGSLRNALESSDAYWIVFDVNGTIQMKSQVKLKSNKTVDGRGRDITIDGGELYIKHTKNIILSDIKVTFPNGYRKAETIQDLISVRGDGTNDPKDYTSRDLWFHHLELTQGNDGAIDLRGATGVTVSWSYIHHHEKAFLFGKNSASKPAPGMRVTLHHNFLEWVSRRGPKMGFGLLDFFNNYHKNFVEYGIVSHDGAQTLSQNNIFEARPGTYCVGGCPDPNTPDGKSNWDVSKKAIALRENEGGETDGYVKSVGDVLINDATIAENKPEKVFNRSSYYSAKVDPANETLKNTLMQQTGPRRDYCK